MKNLIILIAVCFLSITAVQSQEPCLETRLVLSETVNLWVSNFAQIQNAGILGSNADEENVFIPASILINFMTDENNQIPCPTLNFWYYLNEENLLCTAIGKNGDSTNLLIHASGEWSNSSYDDIKIDCDHWINYAMDPQTLLIYISRYSFNWLEIKEKIETGNIELISIQNVVYSVSPFSGRYEFAYKEHAATREGYLAVDILLNMIPRGGVPSVQDCYNFAMPCPKNCPTK